MNGSDRKDKMIQNYRIIMNNNIITQKNKKDEE